MFISIALYVNGPFTVVRAAVIHNLGVLYSYRRGLRSCLSVRGGKFEGLDCEISNEYESHAFFVPLRTAATKK